MSLLRLRPLWKLPRYQGPSQITLSPEGLDSSAVQ